MLAKYNLKMPHSVFSGEDALENICGILEENQVKHLAVFTDQGIRGAGLLEAPMARVEESGVDTVILDDLPAEPTYAEAQKLVDQCKACGADFIMAVGGGSVMDTAKLAGVLLDGSSTVHDLLEALGRAKKCCPTLMIPTTAGTGSEATPNAIVAVPEQELKVGIVSDAMIADNVLLDPLMIKNLPRKIAAATGVDALAHAIECYTSNKANPISDTFALEALDMILNNILPACDSADAVSQKSAMQLASFYAGVAITASGTTAVHALSYPLGGKYHIAHGVSNAILLAPVMRFNAPACPERFAAAYDRCVHGEKTCVTQEEKTEFMLRWLEKIVRHLEIPTSLSAFGVPASDLETLVAAGMQVTRLLNNNLRPVTADDARALYRRIL